MKQGESDNDGIAFNFNQEELDTANNAQFKIKKSYSDCLNFSILRKESPVKFLLGHLNINSLRNKSECVGETILNSIDICLISEATF